MKYTIRAAHLLGFFVCAFALTNFSALHAVKVHTLGDLNRKSRDPKYYKIVINRNIYDNVEVHPDFADEETIAKFMQLMRKNGISCDKEILDNLKNGFLQNFSSLLEKNHKLTSKSNQPIYFILASCGVIIGSFLIYKIIQYYRNKQEKEAVARQELQQQSQSIHPTLLATVPASTPVTVA